MSWHLSCHGSYCLTREGGRCPIFKTEQNCHNLQGFYPSQLKNIILWQFWFPPLPHRDIYCVSSVIIVMGDTASTWVIQIVSLKCRRVVKIKESLKPSRIVYILVFVSWQYNAVFYSLKLLDFNFKRCLWRWYQLRPHIHAQCSPHVWWNKAGV